MLCVATFRRFCHFAEPGYSVFQVLVTLQLRQPYNILTDSLIRLYPPSFLVDQNDSYPFVFQRIYYEISIRRLTRSRIPEVLDFTHPHGGTLF